MVGLLPLLKGPLAGTTAPAAFEGRGPAGRAQPRLARRRIAGAGADTRQRVAAAEPVAAWREAPPNGRLRMTKPVAPCFSQASCSRRPAVRSTSSISAATAATPAEPRASSKAIRAAVSSRTRTWISRRAGKPSVSSPGA
jgi:hypothetical protein